jgi:hypothetical protein
MRGYANAGRIVSNLGSHLLHEPSFQDGISCVVPTRHSVPGSNEASRWDEESHGTRNWRSGQGAGLAQQRGVGEEIGEAEVGEAALLGAEHIAGAAQAEVGLGDLEAVGDCSRTLSFSMASGFFRR